jgi:membrane fusion protein, copper/silver efflux system
MTKTRLFFILPLLLTVAMSAGYIYLQQGAGAVRVAPQAAAAERTILYYRDPSGAPNWSATPKTDAQGKAYLPVYDDAEASFDPPKALSLPALTPLQPGAGAGERKILYYRNPMGLPDTSPVPKKDSMGMDYIAVYEGDEPNDGKSIKISLDKVQRSGVRTEAAAARILARPVRAVGTVAIDERRATIVTMRSDGYVEELFVNTTGQVVQAGQPLFRVYSPDIQLAFADLLTAKSWLQRGGDPAMNKTVEGAVQRLRNLGLSEARIRQIRDSGVNPRTIDWLAPAGGTVTVKRVINGQRVTAGDELYRIIDLSNVWVIADVAERDLIDVKVGARATVTFRAYGNAPVDGAVTFIYPQVKTETRTVQVRIELANPEGKLKPDMYADVVFHAEENSAAVTSVPASAVIDSGAKQIVLVAKGEGRFEPRGVKLGRRGEGYVEIADGLKEGEEIVTTATFLIDAESNLQSALKSFTAAETAK